MVDMSETKPCEVCGAHVVDLRRGRCFGCYALWAEARPVGVGACCTICGDRRRDNLRQLELLGAWIPMCGNCAGRTLRLRPLPRSVEAIRQKLARERRGADRRTGQPDLRAEPGERRGLERRSVGHPTGDGDMLLVNCELGWELDEMLIELMDEDLHPLDPGEETRIVQRV
jgi:hypothetical protein